MDVRFTIDVQTDVDKFTWVHLHRTWTWVHDMRQPVAGDVIDLPGNLPSVPVREVVLLPDRPGMVCGLGSVEGDEDDVEAALEDGWQIGDGLKELWLK